MIFQKFTSNLITRIYFYYNNIVKSIVGLYKAEIAFLISNFS